MEVLLITYDLNRPGQEYAELYKRMKQFAWAKLSESSYAVETDLSPKEMYELLTPCLDKSDHVFVMTLHSPYHGYGPKDVIQWLDNRLKRCAATW